MRRLPRLLLAATVAVAGLLVLAALSQAGYTASPDDAGEVRLTWRARVPRVEECRRLTQEEQAALPAHMRREEVCEGRVASYRLEVHVDGRSVRSATVSGAGARGDRPLYVFERLPLDPGAHDLTVSFVRVGPGDGGAGAGAAGGDAEVPDRLLLRETFELGPREVALVVYEPSRRRLELRRAGPAE